MPEFRRDPLQKRWIVITPERVRRPAHLAVPAPTPTDFCPFCPGNESTTPPAIRTLRDPERGDWRVRVIPNQFPALKVEGPLETAPEGPYDWMNGLGAHEVIIESPIHDQQLADMDYRGVEQVIQVYVERQRDLLQDRRLQYVLLFKNHGAAAGGTLAHPHSQLIAMPTIPFVPDRTLKSARAYWLAHHRCVFCDMLKHEMSVGQRIVWSDEDFIVLTPYASRFPFEIQIVPRRHVSEFTEVGPREAASLARVLRDTLRRLKIGLGDPPFNLAIHTAPNPNSFPPRPVEWDLAPWSFHWYLEILPRLGPLGGFEWGTGFFMNAIPPEDAAELLREIPT